jgi:hypothetical protein
MLKIHENGREYELEIARYDGGWTVISSWNAETVAGPFKTQKAAIEKRNKLYLSHIK